MISKELATISSEGDAKDRVARYKSLLDEIVKAMNPTNQDQTVSEFKEFITFIVHESVGLNTSRLLLSDLLGVYLRKLKAENEEQVLMFLLDRTADRSVAFEEAIASSRERVAELLIEKEEWTEAARMLQGIPMESGHRQISDDYKLGIYNQIVRLYLEDEDSVSAEAYLNRMSHMIHNSNSKEIHVQFRASQARLADFKKQFLQAATKYHQLSLNLEIDHDERVEILKQAIICAIMAQAGPLRDRLLSTLHQDSRTNELGALYEMLQKVYFKRIVLKSDLQGFSQLLKPHHLARLPNGATVLDRSIMEHNILAVSLIYSDISIQKLSTLLGSNEKETEKMLRSMICESRLEGFVDGLSRVLYLTASSGGGSVKSFDSLVARQLLMLESISSSISSASY